MKPIFLLGASLLLLHLLTRIVQTDQPIAVLDLGPRRVKTGFPRLRSPRKAPGLGEGATDFAGDVAAGLLGQKLQSDQGVAYVQRQHLQAAGSQPPGEFDTLESALRFPVIGRLELCKHPGSWVSEAPSDRDFKKGQMEWQHQADKFAQPVSRSISVCKRRPLKKFHSYPGLNRNQFRPFCWFVEELQWLQG